MLALLLRDLARRLFTVIAGPPPKPPVPPKVAAVIEALIRNKERYEQAQERRRARKVIAPVDEDWAKMPPALQQPPEHREEIESLIAQSRWPDEWKAAAPALISPAVFISRERCDLEQLPIGASRFGGEPDVPADFEWPHFENQPLTFLAQFNFEQIAHFDATATLPRSGQFYVFAETQLNRWGYEESAKSSFRTLWIPDPPALHRAPQPPSDLPKWVNVRCCKLRFRPTWTMPDVADERMDPTVIDEVSKLYRNLHKAIQPGCHVPWHHFLGDPLTIQNAMRQQAAYGGNWGKPPSNEAWDALSCGEEWTLLLQLDSDGGRDDSPGWLDGGGTLYFWISREDLAQQRLDKVVWIFQF